MARQHIVLFACCFAAVMITGSAISTAADTGDASQATLETMGLEAVEPEELRPAGHSSVSGRALVDANLVLQEGDTPTGITGAVATLNGPFTNGVGDPGFVGDADDNFVWSGTGIVWGNPDGLPTVLSGGESTMGIGDAGQFIYSPSIDGDDGVWTQAGQLAKEATPAPGLPGFDTTFHSRPTMLPSGAAYWIAGRNDGAGGTLSQGRLLYTSSDGTPAGISIVLNSDDPYDGQPLSTTGVGFDYQISDNGSHSIHELDLDTGSTTNDAAVGVDGVIVAQEASPNGGADNWDNFDLMAINNDGDYLFSGDTDGATTTDEFIAYNGVIAIREGDVIDGVTLTSTAYVRGLAINNLGQAAFAWGPNTGADEYLFFSCDASDLAGSAQLVLATGDTLDFDGNGVPDATVTDFNASTIGPGLSLAEDGRVFLEIDMDPGTGEVEAVIGLDLPSCGAALAMNEIRIDQPSTDNDEFFELYGTPGASLDGLTYVVIGDGAGGSGTVEEAVALTGQVMPGTGFFVAAEATFTLGVADLTTTLNFENSDNVTHLLVAGFTGAVGDDLDTNDDCVLDVTPWTGVTDAVALIEEPNPPAATECEYATDLGFPTVGPDGSFVPGLVGRDPDGVGPWVIGPFDPIAGGDTPGSSNNGTIPVELMSFSVE